MKSAHTIFRYGGSDQVINFAGDDGLGGPAKPGVVEVGLIRAEPATADELMRLAALGAVSASVAHDLGNLLQIIASGLRLIDRHLRQPTGVDLRPFCDGALAAVDRAALLRLGILEQARAPTAPPSNVDLGAAVAGIRGLIELTAGPDVHVEVLAHKDMVWVECDVQALENVILNLVVNARDAMPYGGRLRIETALSAPCIDQDAGSPGPASGLLRVVDTGCGMSPETVADAFKPFFTTKGFGRGTGLGLAIVCDFARRWGGGAEIHSALGEGTCVTLRLPARSE